MLLEKIAKLKSAIDDNGNDFTVTVYDDELETQEPIMWLIGEHIKKEQFDESDLDYQHIEYATNNNIDHIIYIDFVNFDNDIYFKLPSNKQNSCATVLFKRFIKYYKENFDGVPVIADFLNYELQEKFKSAVEKGVFPKESLEMSKFTSEEEWSSKTYYNKNNREEEWNLKNSFPQYIEEEGAQVNNEGWIINTPVSQAINYFTNAINRFNNDFNTSMSLSNEIYINMINSNIEMGPPIKSLQEDQDYKFLYDWENGELRCEGFEELIKENGDVIRQMLDTCTSVKTENGQQTIDEFFSMNTVTSSFKRLLRRY